MIESDFGGRAQTRLNRIIGSTPATHFREEQRDQVPRTRPGSRRLCRIIGSTPSGATKHSAIESNIEGRSKAPRGICRIHAVRLHSNQVVKSHPGGPRSRNSMPSCTGRRQRNEHCEALDTPFLETLAISGQRERSRLCGAAKALRSTYRLFAPACPWCTCETQARSTRNLRLDRVITLRYFGGSWV